MPPEIRSTAVLQVLESIRGTDVCFVPSGGNAGDALINFGAYRLLELAGVRPTIADPLAPESIPRTDVVVLSGGGGLVPEWQHAARVVDAALSRSDRMVILPQTVVGHADLLQRLRPDDVLILREEASLHRCLTMGVRSAVMLDHDLALNVDLSSWNGRAAESSRVTAFLTWHRARRMATSRLPAWRTDRESRRSRRGRILNDVSRVAGVRTGSFDESGGVAYVLGDLLRGYRRVDTDRLHVVIACALLGIPVRAHDNVNGKVHGVARWSLADQVDSGLVELVGR